MVEIYYGMSGAFKSITLDTREKELKTNIVRSMIKTWKDMAAILGEFGPEYNDLYYTLLHLSVLKNEAAKGGSSLLVERGVTDSLFYRIQKGHGLKVSVIRDLVNEELKMVENFGEVRKILLINKDTDFIKNVILSEEHRRACFPGGVSEYLNEQEKYIRFTSEYNKITDVKEIKNAREYIESLGLEYKINKN